ncbi:hypothetical protein OUZ56_027710 [Daphnia magna]|uniref:Uncharacterized protein n=1 Tax=Daphnia magna TaxID=35525 RepID=A0ABR0B1P8_9CRUS|nr:hypothetical protein OUZ56_027710 [Daphnia magna]
MDLDYWSENGKCHQLSDRFHLRLVNLLGPAVTLKTGTRPCQWLKESDPDPSSWLLACLFRGSFVSIKDFGKEDLLLADIATILCSAEFVSILPVRFYQLFVVTNKYESYVPRLNLPNLKKADDVM